MKKLTLLFASLTVIILSSSYSVATAQKETAKQTISTATTFDHGDVTNDRLHGGW